MKPAKRTDQYRDRIDSPRNDLLASVSIEDRLHGDHLDFGGLGGCEAPFEATHEAHRSKAIIRPIRVEVTKRAIDLVGGALLLAFVSPVLLAAYLLLRLTGATPIYRQARMGRHGERFYCLKFRTMRPDADKRLLEVLAADPEARREWMATQKLQSDPRVTLLGKWLRKSSLDELPQLWNVIRGEMSLVGPRPVVPDEIARYGQYARYYYSVRPGITGLWQVSGRNNTDYDRRVALDVFYAKNLSSLFDLKILLKTPLAVVRALGAY